MGGKDDNISGAFLTRLGLSRLREPRTHAKEVGTNRSCPQDVLEAADLPLELASANLMVSQFRAGDGAGSRSVFSSRHPLRRDTKGLSSVRAGKASTGDPGGAGRPECSDVLMVEG